MNIEELVQKLGNLAEISEENFPQVASILFSVMASIYSEEQLKHLTKLSFIVNEFTKEAMNECLQVLKRGNFALN